MEGFRAQILGWRSPVVLLHKWAHIRSRARHQECRGQALYRLRDIISISQAQVNWVARSQQRASLQPLVEAEAVNFLPDLWLVLPQVTLENSLKSLALDQIYTHDKCQIWDIKLEPLLADLTLAGLLAWPRRLVWMVEESMALEAYWETLGYKILKDRVWWRLLKKYSEGVRRLLGGQRLSRPRDSIRIKMLLKRGYRLSSKDSRG